MPPKGKKTTEGAETVALPAKSSDEDEKDPNLGGATALPHPKTDIVSLMRWMEDRRREDEERRREDEERRREDEEQRREDESLRRQEVEDRRAADEAARFQALLATLAPFNDHTATPSPPAANTPTTPGCPPRPQPPKAIVHPPPALPAEVTFQNFREWRRKLVDYSTMVDLPSLPLPKQLIQLRMCLSLEVQHVLEYKLHVLPDDTLPVKDVLDKLELHVKGQTNEALRRRELFSCKQQAGEPFTDFYVRLKNAAEAVEVCKGHVKECEETQLKQVIIMGVRDSELVQRLIALAPTGSLDDVVQKCYSYEVTLNTASVITSPHSSVRAISQYSREKKKAQKAKVGPNPTKTPHNPCISCGRLRKAHPCPAAESLCHDCGKKGHWSRTVRCPAKNATCNVCGLGGHYDKCCHNTKPKPQRGWKKPQASTGQTHPTGSGPRSAHLACARATSRE